MINLPLNEIVKRISIKTGLSDAEIDQKIKQKLKALSGLISEEGAAHIVANELGVKLFQSGEAQKIANISSGMRNLDVIGKVVQKYELREFKTEKSEGKVASMLIGDDTGVIRVTMWHKQAELINQLNEGDIVKIVGGYVRENNGRKEIHLNDLSKVAINPKGVEVVVKERTERNFERKKIAEITESDNSAEILATIVQVFDINFFEVCPTCNKRVRLREEGFMCPVHNKITPDFNYVLNVYLDDGSDNMRVVLWRDQVEQLLDMSHSQVMSFKEDPSKFEPIKNDLLGNMIKVQGRANKNQTFDRVELVAFKIDKNPDAVEETKRLKEEQPAAPEKKQENKISPKPEPKPEPKAENHEEKKFEPKDHDLEDMDIDEELVDIEDL